jgi:DNA (cytosine-5)-methyltransferase 1
MTAHEVQAVDLFCGAGGTSSGLAVACRALGVSVRLVAINHWDVAIASHRANHPWAEHLCAKIESVDPTEVVPDGRLDLLVASPECTHFSTARGGMPKLDQKRASPWYILPWLSRLYVRAVLIENVPEFRTWGPLGADGQPLKSRKGETFKSFVHAIQSHGYIVSYRVLNAADYGDATSRRRLFILARRGNRLIGWPRQTHSKDGKVPGTRAWRAAREIIDWTIEGRSIFTRRRPLAAATMRRILAGLDRFGGEELRPFLVVLRGTEASRIEEPVPGIAANGNHMGVAELFLIQLTHGGRVMSVDDPLPTITTAHRGETGLVQPFILPPAGFHQEGGNHNPPRSVEDPLQTVTQRGGGHLVEPFLVPNFGERMGQEPRVHSVDEPLPAVTSHGAGGLVQGILVQYNGQSGAHSVEEPVPALTTRDRLALVQPVLNGYTLDIRFRMLQPRELAGAMGFGPGYAFTGTREDVVRQIGNAVAVNVAAALCRSLLGG